MLKSGKFDLLFCRTAFFQYLKFIWHTKYIVENCGINNNFQHLHLKNLQSVSKVKFLIFLSKSSHIKKEKLLR